MRALLRTLLPYGIIFILLQQLVRFTLFLRAREDIDFAYGDIAQFFIRGLWFDLITFSFFALPLAVYFVCMPRYGLTSRIGRRADQMFRFLFFYIWCFIAVAEHVFWSEFNSRFNFIAVDYLVYTQEVIGNIIESYPLGWLLSAIGLASLALTWASYRFFAMPAERPRLGARVAAFAGMVAISLGFYSAGSIEQSHFSDNIGSQELAANGVYNLFYAFWHNELDYKRFYVSESEPKAEEAIHSLLSEKNMPFVKNDTDDKDITRVVKKAAPEKHKNVMIVVMESMSADYMGIFGNQENLTPNLDRLAREGLFFSNAYATGTRTVRGLEAVTLSIPPTPGQSIIRRKGNEGLFSLGFVFKDRGYDTRFIYGGYGYFDNMNAFFAANGFDIIDRTNMAKDEVEFANVWGVCDEDMFKKALAQADAAYKRKQPFMHVIMTTSNHRPYTYPQGRIDIAPKTGRYGGVKYADYSVGKLIEWASKKPWYKDTVFVFVADHTAGAGGKAELAPNKYHIPIIYYAPGFLKPKRYESIASQIDVGPTLLGMLDFSYYTKFYGEDLYDDKDEVAHTFISNYQKVAMAKDGILTVLAPKFKIDQISWPQEAPLAMESKTLEEQAIAYYQTASWWRDTYRRIPTVVQR